MSTDNRLSFSPNVVVGISFMLMGLALMLDRTGVAEIRELLRYWPLLLILFGASVVAQALSGGPGPAEDGRPKPIVHPPLVLLLVIVGIVAAVTSQRSRLTTTRADAGETVSITAVLGGNRQTSQATQFRGGDMTSVMGGARLDLRQATIAPGEEAVIDVFVLMGGMSIYVPREWTVDVEAVQVMGGVRDERTRPRRTRQRDEADAPPPEPAPVEQATEPAQTAPPPRVVVRGFIMMGGLVIRP